MLFIYSVKTDYLQTTNFLHLGRDQKMWDPWPFDGARIAKWFSRKSALTPFDFAFSAECLVMVDIEEQLEENSERWQEIRLETPNHQFWWLMDVIVCPHQDFVTA